jgi:hypothetical protein
MYKAIRIICNGRSRIVLDQDYTINFGQTHYWTSCVPLVRDLTTAGPFRFRDDGYHPHLNSRMGKSL